MAKMTDTAAAASIGAATRELHLPTVRTESTRLAEMAQRGQSTYLGYLAEVLAAEVDDRSERRRQRRVHEARFPRIKRLADFDLSAAPVEADTATCADAGGGTVLIPPTPINGVGSTANLINGIGQIPNALTPGTTHYFMETLVLPSMDVNNQGYVNGSPDLSDNTNGTAFENAGPLALTSTFVAGQRAASVSNG